ncbi:MAG TPA: lipid A export permease/ATP-binding protein MsbA, partial [Solimonas sp.]|nr:lipid A export permease/ATP-binding protein MsbA [Solimonas sp.]
MTAPNPATAPEFQPMAVYRRLLGYTRPHWPVFLFAAFGMVLAASTQVGFMAMVKPLLDGTFIDRDPQVIRWIPWAIVGLFLLRGISEFISSYGMSWIGRHVIKKLRGELFDHLLTLPVRFYDGISSGQLISRLTYHVEQVAEAVTTAFTSVIKDGLTVIGLIGWMFYLNWQLTLFCLVVAPLIAGVIRQVSRRFRKVSQSIQQNMGIVTQAAEEAVTGQRVVKIHNGQDYERGRFGQINERQRWLSMKVVAAKSGSEAIIQFIAAWAVASIVYFATQPQMLSAITPGTFVSFLGAMLSLMNPLKALTNVNERLQRGIAAATEVFMLMAEPAEPAGGERPLQRARGQIEFRDLRFRYRSELPEALRGVSVTVQPGQTVAFVGRSGSGKSTLLALLPRFYDPESGQILLDGHDIREYRVQDLRDQIALVDQQVRLFNASVAENLCYGLDPVPDEARIIEAAKAAYAWEFISKLPQGLQTQIGQNGVMLSGGQRQRIAIARALLKDAPILMLDEATSALDSESERYIQSALDTLVRGRTTLVIAHRLSTIQNADLIVVMQDGRVVERGSHAELLVRDGAYAALHRLQFR